jgi:hypothetical protein
MWRSTSNQTDSTTKSLERVPGVLALTYCRYPPIPSLATDITNRRHLDYCTPLPAAYALHSILVHALPCLLL